MKFLLEAGKDGGGHRIEDAALGEEAFPIAVVADLPGGDVDDRIAALIHESINAESGAAAKEGFELTFVVGDDIERIDLRHADRRLGRGIGVAAKLLDLARG